MTSLTFHISRSIGATLQPGDEILVTTLDHEANVGPWRAVAADRGLTVRTIDIRPDDVTLDMADFERQLTPRTKLVAVGLRQQRGGHDQPGRGDRPARSRGRRPDLRRCRPLRAARPDRRPGARHGLPGLLDLQVLRAAPRRPVRTCRSAREPARPTRSGRPTIDSRPGPRASSPLPAPGPRSTTSRRSGRASGPCRIRGRVSPRGGRNSEPG